MQGEERGFFLTPTPSGVLAGQAGGGLPENAYGFCSKRELNEPSAMP